jgi:hypothetical protein
MFMRVDTNTKGHTNWYYFTVENFNFVGSVRFNICNFRREKSLYQRVKTLNKTGNETLLQFEEKQLKLETSRGKYKI